MLQAQRDDPLRTELIARKGARSYISFADEIAINESMLRTYLSGRFDAGIETLCVLLAWDPALERLIVPKMIARGQRYRSRLLSRDRAGAA